MSFSTKIVWLARRGASEHSSIHEECRVPDVVLVLILHVDLLGDGGHKLAGVGLAERVEVVALQYRAFILISSSTLQIYDAWSVIINWVQYLSPVLETLFLPWYIY